MPTITKTERVYDLADYVSGQYGELIMEDYGVQYDSDTESLWGIWSLIDGNYHNVYFGMNSLITDGRDIISGRIEYIGITRNIGPQNDDDDFEKTLFEITELDINMADVFSSFDLIDDEIDYLAFNDGIVGKAFTYNGSPVDDGVDGSPGDDTLNGNAGNDELDGNAGNDTLNGGAGNDILRGDDGDDLIRGDDGDDNLYGGDGDDALIGGAGNDKIRGGNGNDTLYGGSGTDTLIGGEGDDYLNPMDNDKTFDAIVGGTGFDTIDFSSIVNGYAQLDYGDLSGNVIVKLDGAANQGLVDKGLIGKDTVISVQKPLEAWGLGVEGTDYNDQFIVNVEANQWLQILGGKGIDVYDLSGEGSIRLDLRKGTEGANVNLDSREIINDGYGNAESYTGSFSKIRGTNFNDTIIGASGPNSLLGLGGDDVLIGGGGDDLIHGGPGNDTLTGGLGSDTFVFYYGDGVNIITDFDIDEDGVHLYSSDGLRVDTSAITPTYNSLNEVVYTLTDGTSVTFKDIKAQLEDSGALSVVNSGTISAPVLEFYIDSANDPGGDGVTSVDVVIKFDPTHASFTSFSYADGFLGAANIASAADGTITFGAIALTPISIDKPLFTMTMKDLDSANDFLVTVSDLNVDGSNLEGSVLLVGSAPSHTATVSVVTRDGSTLADVDIVMSDGTNSATYTSAANGSASGELASGSASKITGSLAYSSSSKAISSQDALDALKLSVGMTTAAGTKTAFDYIAADFNQDGKVSSQDALAILKYAVGLSTTEQAKWVFVDTNGDYSRVSKTNTSYTEGVSIAELSADTTVGLTGILIGDVNDSFSGLIA